MYIPPFYFKRELQRRANLPPLIRSAKRLPKGTIITQQGQKYKVVD